jgi:hypothetical protein
MTRSIIAAYSEVSVILRACLRRSAGLGALCLPAM